MRKKIKPEVKLGKKGYVSFGINECVDRVVVEEQQNLKYKDRTGLVEMSRVMACMGAKCRAVFTAWVELRKTHR